jgi:hypothetical protein
MKGAPELREFHVVPGNLRTAILEQLSYESLATGGT